MRVYYRKKGEGHQIIFENGFCLSIYDQYITYEQFPLCGEKTCPCPDGTSRLLEVDEGLASLLQGVCGDDSKPAHIYQMRVRTLANHVLRGNN